MSILNKIIDTKKKEISQLKSRYSISSFNNHEHFSKPCRSFIDTINGRNGLSIIAEIKKASPSKGIIREDFNHLRIAEQYFQYGANAVSVLTDSNYFHGSIEYLNEIAFIKKLPVLRKDFIFDEIQIYQSKAIGADFILLISEVLSKEQISEFSLAANELGMEVLLEIHSKKQLEKIDFDINRLIGINNRNLEDFTVDMQNTINISKAIPPGIHVISESGISDKYSVEKLKNHSIAGVLVGEYFMRQENIGLSLHEFKEWCRK